MFTLLVKSERGFCAPRMDVILLQINLVRAEQGRTGTENRRGKISDEPGQKISNDIFGPQSPYTT